MKPTMLRSGFALAACATAALGALTATPARAQNLALGVDTANLDTSVRPQDDFFRYVNGRWLRNTQIPADRSSYGSFDELSDRSEQALRQIIEQAAAAPSVQPGSESQKVRDLYASYMDSVRIERLGIAPLRPELARIAAVRTRAALPTLFAELGKVGVQTPFSFGVGQDAKQATRYIAYVGQSGLGLPDKDYYFKQEPRFARTRAEYQSYIETLLRLAGQPNPAAAARNILALETALAGKHWDRARTRDREATYNLRTVAQLDALTPGFSWSEFLRTAGASATPGVVVEEPDYLPAMNEILARTPLETIRQYLTFKLLDRYAGALSSPFANAAFAFRGKTLQGLETQRPRWKRGVGTVEGALGEAVGKLYVQRNFQPEQKARMQRLVDNLLATFRTSIDSLEWMSPATRAAAKEKLAGFTVKIAYPDQWRDYSALDVRPGDLLGNLMRARRFDYQREVGRLGKPIDRTEWGMTPQTVNAYYNASLNEIVFPAAILQPPFFDPAADDAVNYGGIGAVIGHEISHGFDDQGRRSDASGNLRDWWTAEDAKAFDARANQLVNEYNAFTPLEGLNINGRLTLGENIGDLSGLAVAYKAYQRSLGGRPAPVIGGFTGDQRFFMGWAQVWRSLMRDDALRQLLLTNPHSPGEYRVNGIVRNLPEFYTAFDVKPGDKMYVAPEQRVKIW